MQLTKEQSFEIIAHNEQRQYFGRKFKFVSKTREICLGCAKPIYISFGNLSVSNVFCDECKHRFKTKRTIVQYRYMNYIKNHQTKIIQQLLNADNPNFTKEVIRPILIKEDNITKHNIEPVSALKRFGKSKNSESDNISITPYLETVLEDFAL